MVVTEDGHATCNGGARRRIADQELIDAREVEREVRELAGKGTDLQVERAGARQLRAAGEGRDRCAGPRAPAPRPRCLKATLFALKLRRAACESA